MFDYTEQVTPHQSAFENALILVYPSHSNRFKNVCYSSELSIGHVRL